MAPAVVPTSVQRCRLTTFLRCHGSIPDRQTQCFFDGVRRSRRAQTPLCRLQQRGVHQHDLPLQRVAGPERNAIGHAASGTGWGGLCRQNASPPSGHRHHHADITDRSSRHRHRLHSNDHGAEAIGPTLHRHQREVTAPPLSSSRPKNRRHAPAPSASDRECDAVPHSHPPPSALSRDQPAPDHIR